MNYLAAIGLRNPRQRYQLALAILEDVTRYLSDIGDILEKGSALLRNPQDACEANHPYWPGADSINEILTQWQTCLVDAWASWELVPAHQRDGLQPPRWNIRSMPTHVLCAPQTKVA